MIEHKEEYLNSNLVAYIGNKRRLMPLIEKSIKETKILNQKRNPAFLDLFAGSGAVSRLAKILGFEVYSNDWEYYSFIINKAFIEFDRSFLDSSFLKLGGIDKVLDILNNLNEPKNKDKYISIYYCPEDDDNPDLKNERIFYTNYNGKKIDAIRGQINEWAHKKLINKNEEYLLLGLLLYEASTRSNTSGVFKGFHNGFGGVNKDALTRILKPIQFKKPVLINGQKSFVYKEDAIKLVGKFKDKYFDIVYLDPPYNQHQYGSNYHLLNTIALNDKPVINKNIYINDIKTNKSAIRKDWIKTKSTFCYKDSAKNDFKKIVDNINAKYILVSYSTDGIIDFNDMLEILSKKGRLDLVLSEYVKYRGGKQALTSQVNNIEFVLIIDTSKKGANEDIERVKKILILNKINIFMKKTINPIRAESVGFSLIDKSINLNKENSYIKLYNDKKFIIHLSNNKIIKHNLNLNDTNIFNLKTLINIYEDFEYITNLTKEDEVYLAISEVIKLYKMEKYREAVLIFKEVPYYISKFNNKKAYIPSLKAIISTLDMMIQTIDIWKDFDIINKSFFKKFEKIIFLKLNYNINNTTLSRMLSEREEKTDINKIEGYKKKISYLYEYFINNMEKQNKARVFKKVKTEYKELLKTKK